jgi:hypothetical protein
LKTALVTGATDEAATPSRRARDDRLAEALWGASERTLAAWL